MISQRRAEKDEILNGGHYTVVPVPGTPVRLHQLPHRFAKNIVTFSSKHFQEILSEWLTRHRRSKRSLTLCERDVVGFERHSGVPQVVDQAALDSNQIYLANL